MRLTLLARRNGIALMASPPFLANTTRDVTSLMSLIMISLTTVAGLVPTAIALVLIPTLYVMLEERFPRRVRTPGGEPVLQGDPA